MAASEFRVIDVSFIKLALIYDFVDIRRTL